MTARMIVMGFMDIFRPKHKHSDSSVRLEAVRQLTDQETLKKIAKYDDNLSG
jgi:hypothetical protein